MYTGTSRQALNTLKACAWPRDTTIPANEAILCRRIAGISAGMPGDAKQAKYPYYHGEFLHTRDETKNMRRTYEVTARKCETAKRGDGATRCSNLSLSFLFLFNFLRAFGVFPALEVFFFPFPFQFDDSDRAHPHED